MSLTTYSLDAEFPRILERACPVGDVTRAMMTVMVHFVPSLVSQWTPVSEPNTDNGIVGTGCDNILLQKAQLANVPLVTRDCDLAKKASRIGVPVYTPNEFLRKEPFNVGRAQRLFLRSFDQRAPAYLAKFRDNTKELEAHKKHLDQLWDYYLRFLWDMPPIDDWPNEV